MSKTFFKSFFVLLFLICFVFTIFTYQIGSSNENINLYIKSSNGFIWPTPRKYKYYIVFWIQKSSNFWCFNLPFWNWYRSTNAVQIYTLFVMVKLFLLDLMVQVVIRLLLNTKILKYHIVMFLHFLV